MAPFRPSNINKRIYPGNAGVIGPTTIPTIGFTTTTCCASYNVCSACAFSDLVLGCRCSYCYCPCCNHCCSCPCTVCNRTVPSGMWRSSEQYESRKKDTWGDDSCSAGAATCICCTDIGQTNIGNVSDYGGFFICCGPTTCKWFVSPCCTLVCRTWYCRADSVTSANSCVGSYGWFMPSVGNLQNPGSCCRTYWDDGNTLTYWANNEGTSYYGCTVNVTNGDARGGPGVPGRIGKNNSIPTRAFRFSNS